MVRRPVWSTRLAIVAVGAGLLTAVAGLVVAFLGSLCEIGASCTNSDHVTTGAGFALIVLGLCIPPLLAAWGTRHRRWLLVPVVVVGAAVVAVQVENAHNAARDRQAEQSYQAALSVAQTINAVAGFVPGSLPPPGATVTERAALGRRIQAAESATLRADRDRLAGYGIGLGSAGRFGQVNVSYGGRAYCYRLPLFVLRGSALPGPCP